MQHAPLGARCSEELSMLLPPLGALKLSVLCAAVLNRPALGDQACAREVRHPLARHLGRGGQRLRQGR
eukprot:scaffold22266_cov72-Phaeocystis_antarctica.AAC.2